MIFDVYQQASKKTINIRLYDDIRADGEDFWTGEPVESKTSAATVAKILDETPDAEHINLFINSRGGDCFEAMAIYNNLKRHNANVTVYIDGWAASAASVIAMAGDDVVIAPNALMMIHHACTEAAGNAGQLRKAADDLEKIDASSNEAYKLKAGAKLADEKLVSMLDAETWLNADEAVKYGLADRVAVYEPEKPEDEAKQAAKAAYNDVTAAAVLQQVENAMRKRREALAAAVEKFAKKENDA